MLYPVLVAVEPVWLSGLRVVAIAGLECRIIRQIIEDENDVDEGTCTLIDN